MSRSDDDVRGSRRSEYFRAIPAIDTLLRDEAVEDRLGGYPRAVVASSMRRVAERWRERIEEASDRELERLTLGRESFLSEVEADLRGERRASLGRVINAAGVIINTNLGRALLPKAALEALEEAGGSYCNLEFDLAEGVRGSRLQYVSRLLCELTGAEDALVVNNNAAAVLLGLDTWAKGREVVVSRGQLIEIGDSFRLPDVLVRSGARLVEVGTTNRTYVDDYAKAIGPETAILLRSHTSNYRIVGFSCEVGARELASLAAERGLISMEDLGSGLLVDLAPYGLAGEPLVTDSVKAGIDIVTFSGDKLLGGPQAGIAVGRRDLLGPMKRNPLARALRIDKLVLAALIATLSIYRAGEGMEQELPVLRMIARPIGSIRREARRLARRLAALLRDAARVEVIEGISAVGGGALPGQVLPSALVALRIEGRSATWIADWLRSQEIPIISRIEGDSVVFDLRTLQPGDAKEIARAVSLLREELGAP
jgi:L-seryl-tRNA(Ser) seleniumtransferase